MTAQIDMFNDRAVFAWPCTGPGPLTHLDISRNGIKHYWRAHRAPILSARWAMLPVYGDDRLQLHWRHPSPNTRGENERDRIVAASINPDGFYWSVRFVPLAGTDRHWAWSGGQSTSMEAAKIDTLARLHRMVGYHMARTEVADEV